MLIDQFLATYHFNETHSVIVKIAAEHAYSKMMHTQIGKDRITRTLLSLRGMSPRSISIAEFGGGSFARLGELPDKEILFGIISRNGRFTDCNAPSVSDFLQPGNDVIRSVINFTVDPLPAGVRISTETRIYCGNEKLKRQFSFYWFFIEPFSRLIRIRMLKELKKLMEEHP